MAEQRNHSSKNTKLALLLGGLVCGMVALSFASVPLYRIFCQVTGYGGTTQQAETAPGAQGERKIKVVFDANVNNQLGWDFGAVDREVTVTLGEAKLAYYRATNEESSASVGTATFNVTPLKAGKYFSKIDCFCFTEQELAPGQSVDMPVNFYVDPAMNDDQNMDDVKTITLSYTFFRSLDDWDPEANSQAANTAFDSKTSTPTTIN